MTPEQLANLQSIEWAGGVDSDGIALCPACQRKRFYHDDRRNHRADCWLAEALRAALASPPQDALPMSERTWTSKELVEAIQHGIETARMQWICPHCERQSAPPVERTCGTCAHADHAPFGLVSQVWCNHHGALRTMDDGCIKHWTIREGCE